jgi:hypothetical protein
MQLRRNAAELLVVIWAQVAMNRWWKKLRGWFAMGKKKQGVEALLSNSTISVGTTTVCHHLSRSSEQHQCLRRLDHGRSHQ